MINSHECDDPICEAFGRGFEEAKKYLIKRDREIAKELRELANFTGPRTTEQTVKWARGLADRLDPPDADPVNVRDFGATGDGVTDDREAFQAAVNHRDSYNEN